MVDNLLGEQEIKTLEALPSTSAVWRGDQGSGEGPQGPSSADSDEENELHSTDDHVHGVLFDDAQRFWPPRVVGGGRVSTSASHARQDARRNHHS